MGTLANARGRHNGEEGAILRPADAGGISGTHFTHAFRGAVPRSWRLRSGGVWGVSGRPFPPEP